MKRYFLTESQLFKLLVSHHKLAALEKGGVNNWEWYSESLGNYLKAHNEEDFEAIAAKELEDFECGEFVTYKEK